MEALGRPKAWLQRHCAPPPPLRCLRPSHSLEELLQLSDDLRVHRLHQRREGLVAHPSLLGCQLLIHVLLHGHAVHWILQGQLEDAHTQTPRTWWSVGCQTWLIRDKLPQRQAGRGFLCSLVEPTGGEVHTHTHKQASTTMFFMYAITAGESYSRITKQLFSLCYGTYIVLITSK